MKFEQNPDQQKELDSAVRDNPVRRWLKSKDLMKFEVGDVLVKYHLRTDYQTKKQTWVVENIKSENKMAQRYVYIYEDDTGIGYLRALRLSDGSLGKELYCLTDFDYSCTKFEVDPEYAEHTFLDAEFDIKNLHKKSLEGRKIVQKMNKKIGKRFKTIADMNDFFKDMKGGKFWLTQDYTAKHPNECVLEKIQVIPIFKIEYENDWTWRKYKENNPLWKNDAKEVTEVTYKDKYGSTTRKVYELSHNVFFLQEPAQVQE